MHEMGVYKLLKINPLFDLRNLNSQIIGFFYTKNGFNDFENISVRNSSKGYLKHGISHISLRILVKI